MGPEELTDEIFEIVVEGYNELIPKAKAAGVEILVENHWGPTKYAENTVRLLEEVDGLGLLFDTNNWAAGTQESAWQMCARYARLHPFQDNVLRQPGQRSVGRPAESIYRLAREWLQRGLGDRIGT